MSTDIKKHEPLKNKLLTYYEYVEVDLTRGLDFTPRETVFAKIRRLQHVAFAFKISIKNSNKAPTRGTVRIFMLPRDNERGEPFILNEQRLIAVELDKFAVTCK